MRYLSFLWVLISLNIKSSVHPCQNFLLFCGWVMYCCVCVCVCLCVCVLNLYIYFTSSVAICCGTLGLLLHDPVSFQCKLFHSSCVFDVFMGENECHVFLFCHFEHLLWGVIFFWYRIRQLTLPHSIGLFTSHLRFWSNFFEVLCSGIGLGTE